MPPISLFQPFQLTCNNNKNILFGLSNTGFSIRFLWVPSHMRIQGNEVAYSLARSSSNLCLSSSRIPWSDLIPLLRQYVFSFWSIYWNNSPANFAVRLKSIITNILNRVKFHKVDLPRSSIVHLNRLRIGHQFLTPHAYKLDLNNYPMCTLHMDESICDLPDILCDCPSLSLYVKLTVKNITR